MPDRHTYLDTVCGVLIIHMILGHCFQWAQLYPLYEKYTLLLCMFMPWFFYKSGMFFKPQPLKPLAAKLWSKLLIPFIVYSVIGEVLWTVYNIATHQSITLSSQIAFLVKNAALPGNMPLWFLTTLFAVRLGYAALHRLLPNPLHLLILSIALCLGIHLLTRYTHYPTYLFNIPIGLSFYAAGCYCQHSLQRHIHTPAVVIGALLLFLAVMIVCPVVVDMRVGTAQRGSFWLYLPTYLAGIIAYNGIARWLVRGPNLLSHIGRASMRYYVLHWIIIIAVTALWRPAHPVHYLLYLIAANLLLLPLLSRTRTRTACP